MDCLLQYDYGAVSDPGLVRRINEDSLGFCQGGDALLTVVADGMGGHSSGEVASRICVETMREVFLGSLSCDPEAILRDGFLQANAAVLRQSAAEPRFRGMGATVAAAILRSGECWFSHLGDSRIYLIEPGKVQRLTRDHTVLQELLDDGVLTEQQAVGHRMAHVVSKAVGHLASEGAEIEVGQIPLREGSALLLCSDGLTDLVSDEEIYRRVIDAGSDKACNDLLELVFTRGARDNVTIQVIRSRGGKL